MELELALELGTTLVLVDVVTAVLVTVMPVAVRAAILRYRAVSSRLTLLPAGAASLLSTASFIGQKTTYCCPGGGDWRSGCVWRYW